MVLALLACSTSGGLGTETLDDAEDPSYWSDGDDGNEGEPSGKDREDGDRPGTSGPEGFSEECPLPTECVELAEAVDRGHASIVMDYSGIAIEIHHDYSFCIDDMLTLISSTSQDAIGGTGTRTETSRGETLHLSYGGWGYEAGWWCIEPDQVTAAGAEYQFNGSHAPTAMEWRAQTKTDLDDDGQEDHEQWRPKGVQAQYNIWDFEEVSPVLVVGRSTNYLAMQSGESTHVVIEVRNIGRVAGSGYVVERFQPGRVPVRYDVQPDAIQTAGDGTVTATWIVDVDAARSVVDGQAVYGAVNLGYELRYDHECTGRDVGTWPEVTFGAADGETYRSRGSSLVIECCESGKAWAGPG
jgi:hypothetical protein